MISQVPYRSRIYIWDLRQSSIIGDLYSKCLSAKANRRASVMWVPLLPPVTEEGGNAQGVPMASQ